MSRILFRAVVPTVISLLVCASAFAEDEPLVIVVTPSGIEQPVTEANTTVTVIDQQTIEQSNAGSVAELLRGQAGIHIASDFFGDGSQATIDLRGFGPTASSSTLVLVDGRKLNNSTDTASPDLSLIDIGDVAQIEILQGSSGVLYGNQAVGGVVNIIRKKSFEDSARIGVRAGSYNSRQLSAAGNKVFGRNRISASFSDRSTDNYRDHNDAENQRLSVRAERIDRGWTTYIEAEAMDDEIDTPGALLEDEMDDDREQSLSFYEEDYFETETRMIRIGMNKVLDDARTVSVDFTNRDTEREFIQSGRSFMGSETTQDRDNNMLSASYKVVPMDSDSLRSYLVGFTREGTDYELVSAAGPQEVDQVIQDLYLSTQWSAGARGQIDAGVRYSDQRSDIKNFNFTTSVIDQFDIDDTVTVFSLGYSHGFDKVRLFARADQNFRYPTVEEHTSVPAGEEYGLETQEGLSIEVGLEYRMAQNRIRGTLYRIDLENEIAFDSTGFNNLNLDETRRNGLILEGARQWSSAIETRLSFTVLDAEITDGEFDGNQLPLVPERTIRFDGTYSFNPELAFGVEIIAVDEQVFGGDFANELEDLDSYEVVNAHASYRHKNWVLGFRVNNLLDEEYSETGNQFTSDPPPTSLAVNEPSFFPSPERNYWLDLKVTF